MSDAEENTGVSTEQSSTVRELLPLASPRRVTAELGRLMRPRRVQAWVAALGLVAAAAVSLLAAPLLGHIVDLVASGQPPERLYLPVVELAAVALGQGLLAVLGYQLTITVGENMLATLREQFIGRVLHLPLDRIERAGAGDLTSRVSADVALVADAVRDAVPAFLRAGLLIALTVVGLLALDWRFAAAIVVAMPIQALIAKWYLRRSGPMYRRQREANGAQQQQLLDTVGGAATVRAFRLEDDHRRRVQERTDDVLGTALRVAWVQNGFYARLNLPEFLGTAAVLVVGFWLVRSGTATVGTTSAAALYFINLFTPVNQVLFQLDTVQSAGTALARLIGVLDVPQPSSAAGPEPANGAVEAIGVGFAYSGANAVLHGVDLDIPAGARVALVGASGAGKSTLAKLIRGLHRPTDGAIRIGGVALAEPVPDGARTAVALVTQEVHVFAGPLGDDLRLAHPGASDDELMAALEVAGASEWVRALPDGLDTVVGSGGHSLTVVQSQQLALARLVLADPLVAILDEATAEAGSAGARTLDGAASRAVDGRTGLVVAHRLTQAATADTIVVLDGGRIVEQGSHDELLRADGRYARLWSAWSDHR
jgi:ATP-binding cassette subfamily C protein